MTKSKFIISKMKDHNTLGPRVFLTPANASAAFLYNKCGLALVRYANKMQSDTEVLKALFYHSNSQLS